MIAAHAARVALYILATIIEYLFFFAAFASSIGIVRIAGSWSEVLAFWFLLLLSLLGWGYFRARALAVRPFLVIGVLPPEGDDAT